MEKKRFNMFICLKIFGIYGRYLVNIFNFFLFFIIDWIMRIIIVLGKNFVVLIIYDNSFNCFF